MARRVAILGLMLESNRFAPATTREDFLARLYLAGTEILPELDKADSAVMAEALGFARAMDARADWMPVPILLGRVEAGGPVEHAFYAEALAEMRLRLERAGPLDGVYIANHGAMLTTEHQDPDGEIFAMVRRVVGPEVPVVATLDLHANISERMVDSVDVIVGYRTNPHVDMADRGADAAAAMMEMWAGMRPVTAFHRLPLVAPTVTLLTAEGAGPYADLMREAVSRIRGSVLSVSVFAGFAYGDIPKNGMAVLVTTRGDADLAAREATALAGLAWADHLRYRPRLTSLQDATAIAVEAGRDPTLPARIFADVADNPGGGGMGNTTAILDAFHAAGVEGCAMGLFHDPALAAEAHDRGQGARFDAVFNRTGPHPMSERFEAEAVVETLRDGDCVGRRGFYAGRRMALGPTALLRLGGIRVVVSSLRMQCADPVFFEMVGIDLSAQRSVVVKSRGHFRAGFDEVFGPDQVVEVDGPGLSSPVLSRFDFRGLPRPVFPLDPEVDWTPPPPRLSGHAGASADAEGSR